MVADSRDRTTLVEESLLEALGATYRAVTATVTGLADEAFDRPSRCEGWSVKDVLFHLLLDPQRSLVAFASPASEPPTTDSVEYWRLYKPGTEAAARHAEFVRCAASAYARPSVLVEQWAETSEAVLRAAASEGSRAWAQRQLLTRAARSRGREPSPPEPARVHTQGLVIALPDFLATLVVEAALHHLDMTVTLETAPATPPAALAVVRTTLDGLLRAPLPAAWDARTCALKGTGRMPLDYGDRDVLGQLAGEFPLLG